MKSKINKLKNKFQCNNFLWTNQIETFYLSKAGFGDFWLVFIKSRVYAICSKMIENQVRLYFKDNNGGCAVIVRVADKSFSKSLSEILKENKENKIVLDLRYINGETFVKLSKFLKREKIKLIEKSGILDDLRLIKDDEEKSYIKKSCDIVSKTANIIKKELKAGMSELDIYFRILEIFAQNKVRESFRPIVAAGINSANPHHQSSNYKIKKNDIVLIDIGCLYKGYASDLTRTYYLGKIDGKIKAILKIVKSANEAVINGIKAGLDISWADKTARKIIEDSGYKANFIHSVGHAIGIEVHEKPSLSSKAEGVFLSNMVATVEPGIYLAGEFGVRIEDTIAITKSGCEVLTSADY
ncbi:MAG: M24 family metallopeptidase [Elusimicrobiota bacterium]|jgi:Xaa-Pro aminopeptidase|nr:M24 family metallopeptidase [Elusimicrobiota bacterium]